MNSAEDVEAAAKAMNGIDRAEMVLSVAGRIGTAAISAYQTALEELGFPDSVTAIKALRANVDLVRSLQESIERNPDEPGSLATKAILQLSVSQSRVLMAFFMGVEQANDALPAPEEWMNQL